MHKTFDDNLICVFCLWIVTTGSGKTDQRTGQFIWSAKISCPCEIVAVLLIFSFLIPLLKTYKKLQTSMFHSYFNEYAFDDINIYLLTSSCTLHRRKFRTNVSVHICINVSVSACKFFSISLEIYRCLEISVNHIPTRTSINSVR